MHAQNVEKKKILIFEWIFYNTYFCVFSELYYSFAHTLPFSLFYHPWIERTPYISSFLGGRCILRVRRHLIIRVHCKLHGGVKAEQVDNIIQEYDDFSDEILSHDLLFQSLLLSLYCNFQLRAQFITHSTDPDEKGESIDSLQKTKNKSHLINAPSCFSNWTGLKWGMLGSHLSPSFA